MAHLCTYVDVVSPNIRQIFVCTSGAQHFYTACFCFLLPPLSLFFFFYLLLYSFSFFLCSHGTREVLEGMNASLNVWATASSRKATTPLQKKSSLSLAVVQSSHCMERVCLPLQEQSNGKEDLNKKCILYIAKIRSEAMRSVMAHYVILEADVFL